jgi:hypothetical protein
MFPAVRYRCNLHKPAYGSLGQQALQFKDLHMVLQKGKDQIQQLKATHHMDYLVRKAVETWLHLNNLSRDGGLHIMLSVAAHN